jgi:hypothetical protein
MPIASNICTESRSKNPYNISTQYNWILDFMCERASLEEICQINLDLNLAKIKINKDSPLHNQKPEPKVSPPWLLQFIADIF